VTACWHTLNKRHNTVACVTCTVTAIRKTTYSFHLRCSCFWFVRNGVRKLISRHVNDFHMTITNTPVLIKARETVVIRYTNNTDCVIKITNQWILPSAGLFRGVRWFETDVSGLPIGHIFKDQAAASCTAWPLNMGEISSPETLNAKRLRQRNNQQDGKFSSIAAAA
jgi:hypothetical protein